MARSKFRAGDRDRAKALFRKLPRSVRKATSDALDRAANELAEAIRRVVPEKVGDLKETIQVKRGKGAKRERGRVVQEAGADPDLTVRVIEGTGTKGFYAGMVEFGTVNAPAQPHFFPTYRANRKRLARRIRAAQRKAIKEAANE